MPKRGQREHQEDVVVGHGVPANDNILGPRLRVIEGGKEQFPDGPVGDIARAVAEAPDNAIIFMHGIVAKHETSEAAHLGQTRAEARGYVEGVKQAFEGDDNVVVLDYVDLKKYGVNEQGSEWRPDIKAIAQAEGNHGKKIVLNIDPMLVQAVHEPWQAFGDRFKEMMSAKGTASENELLSWLQRQEATVHGEEHADKGVKSEPSLHEVTEAFAEAAEEMRHLLHQFDHRPLSWGLDIDNPFALAFAIYMAKGSLTSHVAREALRGVQQQKDRIGVIHLMPHEVTVSIGRNNPMLRQLRA